jgi:uroporphyrinogen-III synthase
LRMRSVRRLDAVVLAACGLDRLGLAREIGRRFDPEELLPEAGQGAVALQVRAGDEERVARADDAETRRRVEAERACVHAIGAGCLAPVAAHHDGVRLTALERLGHEVVVCPVIAIEPLGDDVIDTSAYDWVVITSANGAAEFARRRTGRLPRVAAIGPATAEALAAHGLGVDLVPSVSTQEGLVAELPKPVGRVLFAGAEGARRHLVEELGADFVALYRTVPLRPARAPDGDFVVLASASAASAFAELRTDVPAVSLGPQPTQAAAAAGLQVVEEARTNDLDGLVAAVEAAARRALEEAGTARCCRRDPVNRLGRSGK